MKNFDIQVNMDSVNISTAKPEISISYSYKRDRSARMLLRQHEYKKDSDYPYIIIKANG